VAQSNAIKQFTDKELEHLNYLANINNDMVLEDSNPEQQRPYEKILIMQRYVAQNSSI
jgi:hypothetical protein